MNSLNIDTRAIGFDEPTFVIAEIGVNHDGCPKKAVELVRIAAECGADAVKFQIFRADTLMHTTSSFAEYQKTTESAQTPAEMLRRYELSEENVRVAVKAACDLNLIPLATPFSPDDMAMVESLQLPAVKIASPDLVNIPLLARVAAYGKPLILSTGAARIDEVKAADAWLRSRSANFAFLHCISSYPTSADDANLCWIGELASAFDVPIGYSDHTTDPIAGAFAVAAGATIVEKHLTYDRTAAGPDHAASADPTQFRRYIEMIRSAERFRGMPGKRVLDAEEDVRRVSRQSLVVRREMRAGEVLSENDLTVQRPGTGMSASRIGEAVGRRVRRAIRAGEMLQPDMLDAAA